MSILVDINDIIRNVEKTQDMLDDCIKKVNKRKKELASKVKYLNKELKDCPYMHKPYKHSRRKSSYMFVTFHNNPYKKQVEAELESDRENQVEVELESDRENQVEVELQSDRENQVEVEFESDGLEHSDENLSTAEDASIIYWTGRKRFNVKPSFELGSNLTPSICTRQSRGQFSNVGQQSKIHIIYTP